MTNITQKIDKQITSLQSKIEALSGDYLTNTKKRQQEQRERDKKKDDYRMHIQMLEYLKRQAEADELTPLMQNLAVSAFYEDMRCFSASKKYCESNSYIEFKYPRPDDVRVKRLQKAGIYTTEDLIEAVAQYDSHVQSAVTPPDKNAIRLRDLVFNARLHQRGDIQFTPECLAKEIVTLSGIDSNSRVLEPEAGIGNIADEAREITEHVDCIERMYDFREILKLKKHHVISHDLLETESEPIYDAVLMNPPFSEECEHIQKAFEFVRPGGSLVAVCSNCIQWKENRRYSQFRDWLAEHTHSIAEANAKFEMTGVHTVILVMDKAA
ncbi:MAG: class I SAM-dependent methyltransferase [Clostridiales bacterium]|jgi:hypothetical protein|nr:class I SAM-dependent methyltransferase [Clostridiales bacterium]